MKKIRRKIAAVFLGMLVSVTMVSGCQKNTQLVFTTGLSAKQLFKIGSSSCEISEAMIYLSSFYNQYTDIYGNQLWDHEFQGLTMESCIKDVVLSKMIEIKVINLMAEEQKVTLSKDEKEQVQKASDAYYSQLSEEFRQGYDISRKLVRQVFEEYTLANKMYTKITESMDLEISDDEARTVTVQMICLFTEDKEKEEVRSQAESLYQKIQSGEDFRRLGENYSDLEEITFSFGRGTQEKSVEEAAFGLNAGEVSQVIEGEEGFYLIKCIQTFDLEATEENKKLLAKQKQREAFSNAYDEIVRKTPFQFQEEKWDQIHLKDQDFSEADFFAIYKMYLE